MLAVTICLTLELACRETNGRLSPTYSADTAPEIYSFRNLATTYTSPFVTRDGTRMWICGGRGTILGTSDGVHWSFYKSGTTNFLSAITGASDGRLWAVGHKGTMVTSKDGIHWSSLNSGTQSNLLAVFAAADGKHLWAAGDKGTILASSDGEHWRIRSSGTDKQLRAIFGTDDGRRAWAVTDDNTIVLTNDGENWSAVNTGITDALYSIVGAPDGSRLWAVGGSRVWQTPGFSNAERSTILELTDGRHWHAVPNPGNGYLFAIFRAQDGRMWATGEAGTILYSRDGEHWSAQTSGTESSLWGIYGSDRGERLLAVGTTSAIVESSGGDHWKVHNEGAGGSLNSILASADGGQMWVFGDSRQILRSNDGETWRDQRDEGLGDIVSSSGTGDGKRLWAVEENYGSILKLTDGEHWEGTSGGNQGTPGGLFSVFATRDGRRQWAVGEWGKILAASDGEHFSEEDKITQYFLYSVFGTPDGSKLWAVGEKGTILESSDGKKWDAVISPTTNSLRSVYCTRDGTRAWAAGDNGTIVERTGPRHWVLRGSGTQKKLFSVFATDDGGRIWAVGEKGTIVESSDGEIWTDRTSGTQENLTAVYASADGNRVWVAGAKGTLLISSKIGKAPFISEAHLDSKALTLELTVASAKGNEKVTAIGVNEYEYQKGERGSRVNAVTCISEKGSGKWRCAFDKSVIQPQVTPSNLTSVARVHLQIRMDREGGSDVYRFDARYDPWSWITAHPIRTAVVSACLIVIGLPMVLLFVRPLWNIRIYQALRLNHIEKLKIPGVGDATQFILRLLAVLPWFIRRSRTLDAWVLANREVLRKVWANEMEASVGDPEQSAVNEDGERPRTEYVPLPIRQDDSISGTQIMQPSGSYLRGLIRNKRTVIQIIGPGGAGKTTLARAAGKWALENAPNAGIASHPMLPVWIDEELDSNQKSLREVVRGRLRAALPDEEIDDVLYSALLEKQYLLIFVDRLSERSAVTRDHLEKIYRSTKVGLLVITSRTLVHIDGGSGTRLYPQPLNSATLLRFMTELLAELLSDEAESRPFSTIKEQCLLGEKLAELIQVRTARGDEDVPLSPLPVRLFVEQAVSAVRAGKGIDDLPTSLPEVYFRYLRMVNPQDSGTAHYIEGDRMMRAAKILGRVAVGDDFIPKEFTRDAAVAALVANGEAVTSNSDPMERLRLNGILSRKPGGMFTKFPVRAGSDCGVFGCGGFRRAVRRR